MLPSLATENVYVEGMDLEQLRGEAELAISNIGLFGSESEVYAKNLRIRFENIIAAVHRASRVRDGISFGSNE